MASDQEFLKYVVEQMRQAGAITWRKMFGEYAVYCEDQVVALVCDNQLFVKPTSGGRALLGTPREGSPFPGARPYFLIDDGLEDPDSLAALIAITARELPPPQPKVTAKAKAKATAKSTSTGKAAKPAARTPKPAARASRTKPSSRRP